MDEIITQKQCSTCGEVKSINKFNIDRSRKGGYSYVCKSCQSIRGKKYDRDNIIVRREKQRKYIKENLEIIRERTRIWSRNHKDTKTSRSRNDRARKRNSAGEITVLEWKDLKKKYNFTCLRCGRVDIKLTLDHVIPISKGGKNVIENAQLLCVSCNSIKGTKSTDYRPK